ncbi:hypothetical protein PsYK624_004340 [Phanerochaete sordida]|uniref:Peroxisome membrane anchor protein Pex14p N-terminal domain-containing protein n=1 Tax=Phanerochaete sordida TaxID=48140 RepID=A0A9P3L7V3_9APHY|nr:hypothetical protein PsYK624_004340 [Phanerochaete sordida]
MSDAASPPPPPPDTTSSQLSSTASVPAAESRPDPTTGDRTELLQRARTFLSSPQVAHEDAAAKRKFLVDKGLNDTEIEGLLRTTPAQAPIVPPRTYPQPPPSNLPGLLVGILRIASWIAGGSAALLLIYFRFIYPRVAQTFHARHSIRTHHKDLLTRLTTSIEELRAAQNETFAVLPPPPTYRIEPPYTGCKTLDDVASAAGNSRDIPHVLLLERAIAEISAKKQKPTAEAILQLLEAKFPWIQEEDSRFENELWNVLSTSVLFEENAANDVSVWSFKAPPPPLPSALESSLSDLRDALPGPSRDLQSIRDVYQTLSSFTGYLSSQLYKLPSFRSTPTGLSSLSPEEEDIRREIRALKGLMLNRRSFLPPRPTSVPAGAASPADSAP